MARNIDRACTPVTWTFASVGRWRCALRLGWTCSALLWLGAGGAAAQGDPLDLTVRGAVDGCLAARVLAPRVAHYLGVVTPRAAALRLELVLDGPQRAELRVQSADAELSRRTYRSLPAACSERRDAVALSIALTLENALQEPGVQPAADPEPAAAEPVSADAAGVTAGSPTAPSEEAPQPAPPLRTAAPAAPVPREVPPPAEDTSPRTAASMVEARVAPVPARTAQPGLGLRVFLGGRWLAGALPTPVWLAALGVELRLTRRLTLGISGFLSSAAESGFASGRARTWLGGAELTGCAAWPLGPLDLQLCAAPTLALCGARGRDYPVAVPASSVAWAALGARVAVRWPSSGPLSLRLLAQWHVSAVRPELEVEGETARLHGPWLGGLLGAELGFALE